jgi:hypothetical protein
MWTTVLSDDGDRARRLSFQFVLGPSIGLPFVMFRLSVREPVAHFRKGKVVGEHKGLPAEIP